MRTISIVEEEDEDYEDDFQEEEEVKGGEGARMEEEDDGKRSRSGSRSGSRRGSRTSSTSSLKEKCLRDIKLDLTLLHRLECVRRGSGSTQGSATTSPSAEEFLVPQPPFPPTSNLGLGRGRARSAASSPVTTPPSSLFGNLSPTPPLQQPPSTRLTPQSSVSSSPTSQASSPSSPVPALAPSSPKAQAGFFSPKFKTLPSPNRRLHSVRSSPQLVLNEIFEEGESDGEAAPAGVGGPPPPPHAVASPSAMRRPRATPRARTASASSSEASDDGPPPAADIPRVTLSPAPSPPESPALLSRGGRPLSAACEDDRKARLLADAPRGGSTENVLDIDTTLRESRSLNCIVGAAEGGADPLEQSSASFNEGGGGAGGRRPPSASITVSSNNITTIYIEGARRSEASPPPDAATDERVVIRVGDGLAPHPNGGLVSPHAPSIGSDPNHYFTLPITSTHRPPLNASEIFLGLEKPPRGRPPPYGGVRCPLGPRKTPPASHGRFSLSCLSSDPPSRWTYGIDSPPVVAQPPSSTVALASSLSKSASHLEALRGDALAPRKLRSSATNGSLAPGRGGYLMDINQNSGGSVGARKTRGEKGSLALHGSSKCCAIS